MSIKYGLLWVLWVLLFFMFEMPAVFNAKTGDTLSEWIWHYISRYPLATWGLIGLLGWATLHFFTKAKWF